jgi:predicted phage terminase large subunit-like protein
VNSLVLDGTPSQKAFIESDWKFPAFVGGMGSGKTYALCSRAIRLLIQHQTQIAYYMPTYDLVRHLGFPRLVDLLLNAGFDIKTNQSNFTIDVTGWRRKAWRYGGVMFRTMEDPDRLVGYEVGHSLIDELDTLPTAKAEKIWQRAMQRNRLTLPDGAVNTMAVGTTPEGFRFAYEQWGRDTIKAEAGGYKLYRGRTAENKHLPVDYIDNLRGQHPAQLLQAYLDGEFVNLNDGIIQRHWFQPSTVTPNELTMGVDLAISLKQSADSSTIVVGGNVEGAFHVVHADAKKATFHETQNWIIQTAERFNPKLIYVEAVQYQLAAVQELMRTTRLPVVPITPDKDKAARLMPLAARYEQGFVKHAPANSANNIKQLEDELVSFPNGAHDDLVDALVYSWLSSTQTGGVVGSAPTQYSNRGYGL